MHHVQPEERHAVVVGAGPAGLMAAEVLADCGFTVTVVEQMRSAGRKFLLAGRSGLNITNSEPLDALLERYGQAVRHLEGAIRALDPSALREWCRSLGEDTYVGSSGRVFPHSWRSTPLLRAWLVRLADRGVRLELHTRWIGWARGEDGSPEPQQLLLQREQGATTVHRAEAVVLALGGGSWPRTGSDGSWVTVLREAGLRVNDLVPANAGAAVTWSSHFLDRHEGQPVKNVSVSSGQSSQRGDLVITRYGIEGTPVYSQTSALRRALSSAPVTTLLVDLHPDLSTTDIEHRLHRRRRGDSQSNWLRRALGLNAVQLGLLHEAVGKRLPDEPGSMAALVKAVPLTVTGTDTLERAISTSGGIDLDELDDRLMLRTLPGVFVAGEMLDWDAPTGGYLLQATLATGATAARGANLWWMENQTHV